MQIMNFKQFFEESNIRIKKRLDFRDGSEVTFDIDGKEYTYHIETGFLLYNKTLKRNMKYAPGKALNAIKKIGTLISKSDETVQ